MDGAALAIPSWPKGMSPYTMPAPTAAELLAAAQQTQLALIDSAYDTAMQQPVAYMNTTFQADVSSQDLMNRAITGLQAIVATGGTVPSNFAWYDVNNQPVTMTLLQLQGLFATGVANVNSLFVYKQTQKAAIRAATTVSDVAKIVW
jgi:flagellar biosynthesis/type III secretory pathway ATPase